ncbi:hypothetical protein [Arthrobacter sp. MDT1-65]
MSLAPRLLAAAGLLAVPALLAVGSQALSRPAEVPPVDVQPVVVDLAPTGADGGNVGDEATTATPPTDAPTDAPTGAPTDARTGAPTEAPAIPGVPSQAPAPAPVAPRPAPAIPADQSSPGLVEREVLGDDVEDDGLEVDGVDVDDESPGQDGD